jgi:hypothetical protein
MSVFWIAAPRSLVIVYQRFRVLTMEAARTSEALFNLYSRFTTTQTTAIFILATV